MSVVQFSDPPMIYLDLGALGWEEAEAMIARVIGMFPDHSEMTFTEGNVVLFTPPQRRARKRPRTSRVGQHGS